MRVLAAEELLHDRYQVLRAIGRGGMGAVYEAIDLRLQHTVAVKEMTAGGSEADAAFEREARLLAALRFQALPVVIDYFVHDGSRFLVMQYIEGEDLAARLRRVGPCPEAEVVHWGVAVLQALEYLHTHEPPIVHRDIKPSNIKLTPRGEIVLLDFGLAKGRVDPNTTVSDEASIFGFTPSYAPPEQLEARGTDPRSDLYALGATMYHLLAGGAPPTAGDRAMALAGGRPDPLAVTALAGVSEAIAAVIGRALELDAARRFQSAAEMRSALMGEAPAAAAPRAAARPVATRRLDAAAPSRAALGRAIDVIVQVRFADSPRLGLEDWPSRRRPDAIDQVSETLTVRYPRDPASGQPLPARLRVALVAPDFDVRGPAERLIDVPPDDYSPRLAFLASPRQTGYCRLNVEVYAAADAVYLGSVPLETEALAERPSEEEIRAATLMLSVATTADADTDADFGTVPADRSTPASASVASAPVASPATVASRDASSWRLPRWASAAAMFAVVVTSLVVWRSAPPLDAPVTSAVPPPVSDAPPSAEVPLASGGPVGGTPTATPSTDPVAPGVSAPAAPAPALRPPPAPYAPPPDPAPADPAMPTAPAPTPVPPAPALPPPETRPSAGLPRPADPAPGTAVVRSTTHPNVSMRVERVSRVSPNTVQLGVSLVNDTAAPVTVAFDARGSRLVDASGRSYPGIGPETAWSATMAVVSTTRLQLAFAVPDTVNGSMSLVLVPPAELRDAPRFAPVRVRLPAQ